MSMLAKMKARMAARTPTYQKDYSIYPFWNMKFGSSAAIRLLPYNDPYTGAFWAERIFVPMQFSDPNDASKVFTFKAPCREMYDQSAKCPILASVRALYGEEKELRAEGDAKGADKLKKIAGFHWKKPTYYYQGFVVKNSLTEEEVPEQPIRVFPFNKQLHQKIYNSIFDSTDDGFETLPTGEFTEDDVKSILGDGDVDMDIFKGYNFIIKKSQQGEHANWTNDSQWSRSLTSLDEEQLTAIAEHGFWDLTKRLPDRPSDEQYDMLSEMMDISIQRMRTGENGVWRPEWEEAGFKPFRPRDSNSNNAGNTPPATTGTTESQSSDSGASGALGRLKAARGKASAEAPVDAGTDTTTVNDEEDTDTPSPVVDTGDKAVVSGLAAKIKARVNQKSA
jgi:hypothetical protein